MLLKNLFVIQSILSKYARNFWDNLYYAIILHLVNTSILIADACYSRIYPYVRYLEFAKLRRSDRETDRIQSRRPDRQTQCYPINSSTYRTLTGQNFSLIVEIGLQRAINVILTTLQRFRSLSRAMFVVIMFKYRSSIGSSKRFS